MALVDLPMPRLSDSMEEATVLQWLKRPGDAVAKGEPLVEVETDKATVVYEAERAGVLEEILVDDGGTAALGARDRAAAHRGRRSGRRGAHRRPPPRPRRPRRVRARRARGRLAPPRHAGRAAPRRRSSASRSAASRAPGPAAGSSAPTSARRAGNGTRGRARAAAAARSEVLELTATQRTIAQRMSESRREIPEFTLEAEIDMEAAARLRDELRGAGREPLPSFNDFVVRAAALALREFPRAERLVRGRRRPRYARINVGIAVATDDALIVPTIHDADAKSVFELAAESRRLAEKVRSRSVGPDDLADGTFTVSNLGMFGVRRFTAVINHPQAAILAVGEVTARPAVVARGRARRAAADGREPLVRPPRSSTAPRPRASCSGSATLLEEPDAADRAERTEMAEIEFREGIRAGARRGARARRARDPLRRGRRDRRRRLRGDAGPVREVRAAPGLRHADLGARDDRRGVRRGGHRAAARCSRSCSATSSRSRWTA